MTWTRQMKDCRLVGHAWFFVAGDWTPKFGGTPMTLRCERCGMERRDAVGANTGELIGRRYVPVPGYYLEKDEPHPTRDDLRLDWVEHYMDQLKGRRSKEKKAS